MKVKLISLDHRGFHDKLYQKTKESIEAAGHEVVENGEDLVHIIRVADLNQRRPQGSWAPISFLMMGASKICREKDQFDLFVKALASPFIHRIIIMTINPASLKQALGIIPDVYADKLVITDEPPYETPEFYRSVSREDARNRLNIPPETKMVLYFGSYFYSKGADLLLEAAKGVPEVTFYMVGDTKLTSFDYDIKGKYQLPNVVWVDEYVSEEKARDFFRACDVVALPYRKFYEHDTSGVFNQAMLAERPVIAPAIRPFTDITFDFRVGNLFHPECVDSLAVVIDTFLPSIYREFDYYLAAQQGWEVIGKCL